MHLERYEWVDAEAAFEEIAKRGAASNAEVLESRIFTLVNLGRAADAAEVIRATISSDPLSPQRSFVFQYALGMLGKAKEAEAEYQRSLDLPGSDEREDIRHWALLRIWNDADAALAIVRAAYDDPSNHDPTRLMFVAVYACHFGDVDLALAAMRRALVDMHGGIVHALWFPDMARMRRTPAFKALVRDIGLVEYWYATGHWGDFCRPVGDGDIECR